MGKGRCDGEGYSRGFKYIDNGLLLSQLVGTQGFIPLFPVPLCGWNISFKNKRGMIPRFGSWARGRNLISAPLWAQDRAKEEVRCSTGPAGRGRMASWPCAEGLERWTLVKHIWAHIWSWGKRRGCEGRQRWSGGKEGGELVRGGPEAKAGALQ